MFIQLYPAGLVNSKKGYVGLYFGLVAGPNDANLTWPFSDRQIRLMIVDQDENPLHAINLYGTFETNTALTSFERPVCNLIKQHETMDVI